MKLIEKIKSIFRNLMRLENDSLIKGVDRILSVRNVSKQKVVKNQTRIKSNR